MGPGGILVLITDEELYVIGKVGIDMKHPTEPILVVTNQSDILDT